MFFQNPTVLSVQLKLTRMHICLTVWIRLLNFVCATDEYINLYVPLMSLSIGSNSKPNILHVNGINMVTHEVASWHGKAFRIAGPSCGNPSVIGGVLTRQNFGVFLVVGPNKLLNKQFAGDL